MDLNVWITALLLINTETQTILSIIREQLIGSA